MLQLSFSNSEQVSQWLVRVGNNIRQALYDAMETEMIRLRDYVVEEKLSGQVLKNPTGTLRRAQHYSVAMQGDTIVGNVFTDPSASKYGKVHEYGGTFSVREHLRKSSHSVGTWVRAHKVTFQERSFLRSSLRENAPNIKEALSLAITRAIESTK